MNDDFPIRDATEAVDAPEENFDAYNAWRIQKYGISMCLLLLIVISLLCGVYIGHFLWQAV